MTNPTLTDGEVIEAVLAGRKDQFALLVRRYHQPLLQLAYQKLGSQQAAEDAVQETFLNAFRSLHTYNAKYSFRTWLWTILKNACHRQYRNPQKQKVLGSLQADMTPELFHKVETNDISAEEEAVKREQWQQIQKHLSHLSPVQAEAIELRFFGQLKFQEIAQHLNCSLPAAKARVRQGLFNLSRLINPEIINSENKESKTTAEEGNYVN